MALLGFGLLSSIVVSAGMFLSGKFPTYYGWMTYFPLSICLCAIAAGSTTEVSSRRTIGRYASLAILAGAVPHTFAAVFDWPNRDYSHVQSLAGRNISPSDWVYGEETVFYAAKPRAAKTFTGECIDIMTPAEKAKISVMFIRPGDLSAVTNGLGGDWVKTGDAYFAAHTSLMGTNYARWGWLAMHNNTVEVYRRAPKP